MCVRACSLGPVPVRSKGYGMGEGSVCGEGCGRAQGYLDERAGVDVFG